MDSMRRYSPISFDAEPRETEKRNGWQIALAYDGENSGPVLVDLSHRSKWDLQDGRLDDLNPWGLTIPETPGSSRFRKGLLINRMNRTQASIWDLGRRPGTEPVEQPGGPAFTETTDAQALIALVGEKVLRLMEKVSRLDLSAAGSPPPLLIQGPVLDIPCQVVRLGETDESVAVLIAFSRGYGHAVAKAFLDVCAREGLRPGGEGRFTEWVKSFVSDFEFRYSDLART